MKTSEEMREAGEKLLELSADKQAQELAQARQDSQWAWNHMIHATEERSREEGRTEGKLEMAIEMAKDLISQGFPRDVVLKSAGLCEEDLE